MLGEEPLKAPWGASTSRARPSRPWQVVRRSSSPARGASPSRSSNRDICSRWEPVAPTFLRDSQPTPRLHEAPAARMDGLQADASLGWFESCDPAVGLTPQELIERQSQRGKLAMLRLSREKAVSRESAALKREKMAYARALGAAASSQAIDQIRHDRVHGGTSAMSARSSPALHRGGDADGGSASAQAVRWAEPSYDERELAAEQATRDDVAPVCPRFADEDSDDIDWEDGEQRWRNAVAESGGGEARPSACASSWSVASPASASGRSFGASFSPGGALLAGGGAPLSARTAAPAEFEKLHRGMPIVPPSPSPATQLERALERGRAATQRRVLEEAAAARKASEARVARESAKQLGQAASNYAIDQMKKEEHARQQASPPSKGGAAQSAGAGAGTGGAAASPGAVPAAAPAAASGTTRAGFGSSTPRCPSPSHWCAHSQPTTAQSQPAPRRPSSPARPVSPRLLRPTASLRASLAEAPPLSARGGGAAGGGGAAFGSSASRNCLGPSSAVGANTNFGASSKSETAALQLQQASAAAAGGATNTRGGGATASGSRAGLGASASRSVLGDHNGALTAVHGALAADLSPIDVYHTLALRAREASGGKKAPPRERAAAVKAAKALLQSTGAADLDAPPKYAPTPSAAASLIQSGYRGMKSRYEARTQKAARGLQKVMRAFLARRRRKHARNKARLYAQAKDGLHFSRRLDGGLAEAAAMAAADARAASRAAASTPSFVRPGASKAQGKWAEKTPAVLTLPMSKSLAKAPPSPSGRPAHQRLHQQASERSERQRQRQGEAAQREELEHIAACTFSPMTNRKEGKPAFSHVASKVGGAGSRAPHSAGRQSQAPRAASPARITDAGLGKEKEPTQHEPQLQGRHDDADAGGASQSWTTVASTG